MAPLVCGVTMRRAIRTNFLLNIGGMVLPLAAAVITVPIYISYIGAARYGILSVVWILLGYFGFMDFGLSRASANALSRLGHASAAERVPVLVTSLFTNAALGVVGGLILYLVSNALLARFAHLPAELTGEIDAAMPWIACMLPVALISGVGGGAIESRERFLTANLLTTFGGLLGQVAPVVCAILISPSLSVVIPAAFLSRLVSTMLIWAIVVKSEHPVNLRSFDRRLVRELMGYGAWVSVTSVISPLMETLDQVLIGALLGPAAIAHYSVPMNISTRSLVISSALAKTLFPRLSRLGPEEAKILAERATVTLAFGFAAICGPAVILAGPALQLWVGPEFAAYSTPVAQILLIGAWTNGVAYIPYTLLQGQGRPDLTAKLHAAEVVPFIIVLWLLMTNFGLPGAALAWTLRTSIDCMILMRISGQWGKQLVRGLPTVAFMAACWIMAWLLPLPLIWSAIAASAASVAVVTLALMFDPASRTLAVSLIPIRARVSLLRWTQ